MQILYYSLMFHFFVVVVCLGFVCLFVVFCSFVAVRLCKDDDCGHVSIVSILTVA